MGRIYGELFGSKAAWIVCGFDIIIEMDPFNSGRGVLLGGW